jgi:hypothetical protein
MDGTTAALILELVCTAGGSVRRRRRLFGFIPKKCDRIGTEKGGREICGVAIVVFVVVVRAQQQVGNVQHFTKAAQRIFRLDVRRHQNRYRCYCHGSGHDYLLSCFTVVLELTGTDTSTRCVVFRSATGVVVRTETAEGIRLFVPQRSLASSPVLYSIN